jgi:hypothetical protein
MLTSWQASRRLATEFRIVAVAGIIALMCCCAGCGTTTNNNCSSSTSSSTNCSIGSPSQAPASSHVEVDHVTYTAASFKHPLKIDIELQNTGTQRAIITALRIRIQQVLEMPACFSQGYLPSTGTSLLNIKPKARPGTSVTVPVNQQVGPDEADRFKVEVRGPTSEAVYLYRTRVTLLYDKSSQAQVGELVAAFPYAPAPNYFWMRSVIRNYQISDFGSSAPQIRDCMDLNSKRLLSFLALSGVKPGLSALRADVSSGP